MVFYLVKNDPDHQTAARTDSDVLAVAEVGDGNLEPIATRTRVVIYLQVGIEGHIFDLDLVVNGDVLVRHGLNFPLPLVHSFFFFGFGSSMSSYAG